MTPDIKAALDSALDTRESAPLFVTGAAGTGKSVFISLLRANLPSGCAVSAPFGLSANNVGGQTVHSLFKFPPHSFKPRSGLLSQDAGAQLLKSMRVLVVDEVSTLTAHLVDAIDATLREGRGSNEPFGGCRVVFVGDLAQLPPVYTDEDKAENLAEYGCEDPFFFSASVFRKVTLGRFRLGHVFRQTNITFVDTLNRVRSGDHTDADVAYLNLRHTRADTQRPALQRTTLYPKNASVDALNEHCLGGIASKLHSFAAKTSGHVEPGQLKNGKYPAVLNVKVGARVMFLDNAGASYSNGTVGTVVKIDAASMSIRVQTKNGEFSVTPSEQKFTRSAYIGGELVTETTGAVVQFPLKLAWAITIHKAQGQTLEEVFVDPSGVFAHGMAYAALSRVREPDGLHLLSPIGSHHVMVNQTLKRDGWL